MIDIPDKNIETHERQVKDYYRFHSRIYDATRWSFLFGREEILGMIPDLPSQPRILEIGCGTGKNIKHLEYYFPDAQILGVDLSEDMLNVARKKLEDSSKQITFLNHQYGSEPLKSDPFDLILLSYSLTMVGNQIEQVLEQIAGDLRPKGYVAAVDFHTSPLSWFRSWMNMNHVNLNGQGLQLLKKYFHPVDVSVQKAYAGLWNYFLFIGQK